MICKGNLYANEQSGFKNIKKLIKSIIFCLCLSILLISILSLVVTYTDVSEGIISPVVNITRLFAILLCSIIMTLGTSTRGWLKGLVAGTGFSLILFLLGIIFIEGYFRLSSPIKLFTEGSLLGMTGGIIGINLRR